MTLVERLALWALRRRLGAGVWVVTEQLPQKMVDPFRGGEGHPKPRGNQNAVGAVFPARVGVISSPEGYMKHATGLAAINNPVYENWIDVDRFNDINAPGLRGCLSDGGR